MQVIDNSCVFQEAVLALERGEKVRIRLVGQSMYPCLRQDTDVLIIGPKSKTKIRVGDTVLAYHKMNYILHRVVSIGRSGDYVLQGDANIRQQEVVNYQDIAGVLFSIERPRQNIIYCNNLWRIRGVIWIKLSFVRRLLLKVFSRMERINMTLKKQIKRNGLY